MYLALKYQARRFFRQGNLLFQMENVFSVITVHSPDNLELKRRSAGSSRASSLLNAEQLDQHITQWKSTVSRQKEASLLFNERLKERLVPDPGIICRTVPIPVKGTDEVLVIGDNKGVDAVTHLPHEEAGLVGTTGTLR